MDGYPYVKYMLLICAGFKPVLISTIRKIRAESTEIRNHAQRRGRQANSCDWQTKVSLNAIQFFGG